MPVHALRLEQWLQDVRYALRFLRANPRFTLVVILTLAVGIGVNTAVFSVFNTVLLKPLACPDPERLVWLGQYDPHVQHDVVWLPDYFAWRREARSFSSMLAYAYQQAAISSAQGTNQVTGVFAFGDFWKISGAHAALGRLFDADEPDCVVLSWDLFERQFASNAQIIGRPVSWNGRMVRVTGVLPKDWSFQFPMWWTSVHPQPVEAFVSPPPPTAPMFFIQGGQAAAALRPGVRIEQAQAELETLEKHIVETSSRHPQVPNLRLEPLQEKVAGNARPAMLVLLAAGVFVLLIASVNVANLLLARSSARRREVAIRAAVGASPSRIVRQLLIESTLLALAGGAAGLLLARWAIAALIGISPYAVPRLSETTLDARVLAYTFAVSIFTAILFGAWPAISSLPVSLHQDLKDAARGSAGPSRLRLRRTLVAVEMSLAIVLLTGAGLMLKSLSRMNEHPPGFTPRHIVVMKMRFVGKQYTTKPAQQTYLRELRSRLEAVPGVQSAGISSWYLWSGVPAFPTDTDRTATHVIRLNAVTPGYLKALGMTLLKGRWLNDGDSTSALLNESMARAAFGAEDPIGRHLSVPDPATIVGVVADVKYSKLDAAAPPEIYITYQQTPMLFGAEIAARTAGDPASIAASLRTRIAGIDPSQPVYDIQTMEQALAESIAPRRFNLFLLGGFALSAFALAWIGIYGVIAYAVGERTREIGVRMVLGARRGQIARLVVLDVVPIAIAGILVGLAAAWALTRLLARLLYDVEATDPGTFAAVAILLAVTAVVACAGPAIKAASVDPAIALRSE